MSEYPNLLLKSSSLKKNKTKNKINFISSTENFFVSKNMFKKWKLYMEFKDVDLNIYSNKEVNEFMKKYFKDQLIYEIYQKSVLPVQKIDIFRICCVYLNGGIWLDLKSQINFQKVVSLYNESNSNGLLMYESRKIEVIKMQGNKKVKTLENVIHNGFFFMPKGSIFLENLLSKIINDYLYFQDIVFKYPKQGIMNLTGPHQFTRTFHELGNANKPKLVSHSDIDWVFCSKYGEFISPLKIEKHYSKLKELKTIDSQKTSNLK